MRCELKRAAASGHELPHLASCIVGNVHLDSDGAEWEMHSTAMKHTLDEDAWRFGSCCHDRYRHEAMMKKMDTATGSSAPCVVWRGPFSDLKHLLYEVGSKLHGEHSVSTSGASLPTFSHWHQQIWMHPGSCPAVCYTSTDRILPTLHGNERTKTKTTVVRYIMVLYVTAVLVPAPVLSPAYSVRYRPFSTESTPQHRIQCSPKLVTK